MVVNIIVKENGGYNHSFIGIDGNGIKVLRGEYTYNPGSGLFEGYFDYGRTSVEKNFAVPKAVAHYATAEKLCYKFLKEMIAEEKSIIVNHVIDF